MSSNLYSQGYGTTSSSNFLGSPVVQSRAPSTGDVRGPAGQYPIGQLWIDSANNSSWELTSFANTSGTLTANWILLGGSSSDVNTLSGDTGTAVPTAGDIKIAGGAGIVTSAAGSTVTVALIGGDEAIDQIGVDASTAPGTNPVKAAASGQVTITGGQVAAGTISNAIQTNSLAANTFTVQIQRTAAAGSSSTANNGVGSFNSAHFSVDANGYVGLVGGGQAVDGFIPDSGTSPVVPNISGDVTLAGSGSITTVGSLNTVTTQLTGLTNHNVLVGAGTSTITKVAPSATSGVPLISQGAAADPTFGTAVVAGGGTGATSLTGILTGNGTSAVTANAVTQHGILIGGASNAASSLGVATNGQLPIGSTGADPVLATLSAGTGISITNGAGSISIATSGGGMSWVTVSSGTQAMAVNTGYIVSNGASLVTFTLPSTAAVGDKVTVVGNSVGGWTIAENTGQQIRLGNTAATVTTGTASSTNQYDGITLVCAVANTSWYATSAIGNISFT